MAPKPSNIVLWHIGTCNYTGTVGAGKFKHVTWKNLQQETQGGKPLALKNQWGGPISKEGVGDPNVMQQVSACVHQECAAIGNI